MSRSSDEPIVVVGARRTAMGALLGVFSETPATELGAAAIAAAVAEAGVPAEAVDEVIAGCVLPAGLGQAPARQAALKAGLGLATGCTTVNKVCGSGMKAVMLAHDLIRAGSAVTVVAAGMESMSNAPYLLPKVRQGTRFGHITALDHMFFDGLENAADRQLMGHFAEQCASDYQFSRQAQDAFAVESVRRATAAAEEGRFDAELTPVTVSTRKTTLTVTRDEPPMKARIEKIPQLPPAFKRDGGTVTAANSSSIADGAAALVVTTASQAQAQGWPVLARIVAHATHAQAPERFTTAPVGAITKVLDKAGWSRDTVDLFEINEAFAVVTMAAIRDLQLDPAKVNVHGGACALGHPIGASGARLLVTLIHALRHRGARTGVASLCIGGGEATAVAVECVA